MIIYNDKKIYRMEKNPETMMRDVIDCLNAGHTEQEINDCLMRSSWIDKGFQLLHRLALRDAEKRDELVRFGVIK